MPVSPKLSRSGADLLLCWRYIQLSDMRAPMRALLLCACAAILASLTAVALAAWQDDSMLSGPDAVGFATITGGAALVLLAGGYAPLLRLLARRGAMSRSRAMLVGIVGMVPVILVLSVLGRNRQLFAGGEVVAIGAGLAVAAIVFTVGYPGITRRPAQAT